MIGVGFVLVAAAPLWIWFLAPQFTGIPQNFSYTADIVSLDNFYNEETKQYSGETRSVTKFSYDVVGSSGGALIVRNTFDVRTVMNKNIFKVERLYAIDSRTGKHVAGFGDRNRSGYLFAPRHLKKGESFTYWHINYDGPAHMTFAGEEAIDGLPVFRYETRYEGVRIDQTKNLEILPGVGTVRGVEIEPSLQIWIEPISGTMVKYRDDTVAYFYDLKTGRRLNPWNHFSNTYTARSIMEHVEEAKQAKMYSLVIERTIPFALIFSGLLLFLLLGSCKKSVGKYCLAAAPVIMLLILWRMWVVPMQKVPVLYEGGPMETIRLGAEKGLLSSPVWVAEHNGYFLKHGLDVKIAEFPFGRSAITSMFNDGNFDMAIVNQTPIVLNSFLRHDFAVIAGMVTSTSDVKIIARKDRNIGAPSDLKGKRIGITRGSVGHYFLSLCLAQHSLSLEDVILSNVEASNIAGALEEGSVDAIVSWEPHIFHAKVSLGENGLVFESKGIFREDFYFVTFKDWAVKNPARLQRFLMAIEEANTFIRKNAEESQRIVAARLKFDPAFILSLWDDYTFKLFLDQAVLLTFEQQARWMIGNNMTDKADVFNYLDYIFFEALEAIKPSAITILH